MIERLHRRIPFALTVPALLSLLFIGTGCEDGLAPEVEGRPQASVLAAGSRARTLADGSRGRTLVDGSTGAMLARIRSSTAAYHLPGVAVDEGFFPASGCVEAPGLGGMGFHYLDPARIGDAEVDPANPEILLYEPHESGELKLVGVEFLVIADAWDAVHTAPPSLLGETFDEHRGPATHGLPFDHYELHVWSWRHNSLGLTAPFNPEVSCGS